jgi:hypothetical protein
MSAPSQAALAPRPEAHDRAGGVSARAWWLIGIVAAGAALRFATLGMQSYWLDEAVTVRVLQHSFGGMISVLPDSESTPPLYYAIAWLWTHVFDTSEVGLRSLSALFGTATIPLAYSAGARLVTPRVGLVVAAIAAFNPLLVWYSQEARSYALLVLLTTAALVAFAHVVERPSRGWLAAWGLLSAFALATHYFALIVVAPEAAWLLWRLRARALPALAPVLLAGAALLPLAIHQADNNGAAFIKSIAWGKRALQLPKQYLVGFDSPYETAATAVALALALYGLWLLATRADERERSGARLAALVALPALVVPLLLPIVGIDYLITRNLIAAWVPAFIVVAAGFGAARAGRTGIVAAALLCAVSLATVVAVNADSRYQREDWKGAAHAIGPAHEPRALVITPVTGRLPFSLYTPDQITPYTDAAVPVREIVVLGMAERVPGQRPHPPRPAQLPAPPAGFQPASKTQTSTYTLLRYTAPTPVPISPAQLVPLKIGSPFADFVIDSPRPR